jgi:Mrp family chromosome partitioning ATPase
MSRNYELMAQLALEEDTQVWDRAAEADRRSTIPTAQPKARRDGSVTDEQMQRLVHRVFLSSNENAPRQVVFCGVDGRNASSSVCAAAGRALALESSKTVCLVDASVRSAPLSGMLGTGPAFRHVDAPVSLQAQCFQLEDNLWLAGPDILGDQSRRLLPVADLKRRLAQLLEEFDFVLIDAPGAGVSGDAQLLGLLADAAILVIEAQKTRKLTARNAQESLQDAGVRLLGTVFANRSFPIPEALYKRL